MTDKLIRRILQGLSASMFGYGAKTVIQLVSVPVFLKYWGVGLYGEWLVLSTIPGYFALSDIGFANVAANEMTMQVAEGDKSGALVTFQSTWAFVTAVSGAVVLLCLLAAWALPIERWLNISRLNHMQTAVVISLLLFHLAVSLQTGLVVAGYRCVGLYAAITFWENVVFLAQVGGLLIAAMLGAGPVAAAGVYLMLRVGGFWALRWKLRRRAPWIVFGLRSASAATVRHLAAPAVAFMGFPAGRALSVQGMVTLVGVTLGPVAVVVFSTTRTLVNTAKQASMMVSHTIWPEFSMAYGADDIPLARVLHRYACQASLWITAGAVLVLSLSGDWLMRTWTNGRVGADPLFFHLMLLVISVNAVWYTSSMVPTAINRHQRLAVYFVVTTGGSLLLAVLLGQAWGLPGIAASLLASEVAMPLYVLPTSFYLLNERPGEFLRGLCRFPSLWRLGRGASRKTA